MSVSSFLWVALSLFICIKHVMIGVEKEVKVCVLIPICTDTLSLMRNVELRLTNSNDRC